MSPARLLRGFFFGGIGGALGWALIEFLPLGFPFQPSRYEQPGIDLRVTPGQEGVLGLVLGLAIGGLLGVAEGIGEGTAARFRRSVTAFLTFGALGGFLGLYFGQILFGALGGRIDLPRTPQEFLYQVFVRSVAWGLMGLCLGLVFGIPNLSVRRMANGAIGGLLGGLLGGFFFQTLVTSGLFQGMHGRLIGFSMLGAMIGFFVNLIVEAMKRVWVKVLVGRNEGREHLLDTPIAYAGRDELAEIPVFLDPTVPKRIVSFRRTNGRYALYPESTAMPVFVNGQPLTPGQLLKDGDAIQFGRVTLGYYEKATATGAARPVDSVPLADLREARRSSSPGVCEFCGQPRDPATGACACTVPVQPGAPGYGEPPPAYSWGGPAAATVQATPNPPLTAYAYEPGAPRLVGLSGPYAGQSFPLAAAEITIGRDPGQDLPLSADSTVSRRHARLIYRDGTWLLRDEGSSNGTWVNGVRIQEQAVFPGQDVIRIGASEFRLEA